MEIDTNMIELRDHLLGSAFACESIFGTCGLTFLACESMVVKNVTPVPSKLPPKRSRSS